VKCCTFIGAEFVLEHRIPCVISEDNKTNALSAISSGSLDQVYVTSFLPSGVVKNNPWNTVQCARWGGEF
jgi:hypothetical protein